MMNADTKGATTMNSLEAVRKSIIESAEQVTAKYPQYRGKWNDHKLVRVKRTIKTKLGVAFVAGEVTVAQDATLGLLPQYQDEVKGCVSAWSKRNGIDTLLKFKDIEWMEN